jgi:iron complex outermembrane receptor protein
MDAQVNYNFVKPGVIAKIGGTNFLNKSYYSILGGPQIGAFYYISLTWNVGKL